MKARRQSLVKQPVGRWDDFCKRCRAHMPGNRFYWVIGAPELCHACDSVASVLPETTGLSDKKE